MILISHVLLGVYIGVSFQSALGVFVLAFLSHFLLDAIPHWDPHFDKKEFEKSYSVIITNLSFWFVVIDFLVAVLVSVFLYKSFGNSLVLVGAFGAVLPDALKLGYFTKLRWKKWYRFYLIFHSKIQVEIKWYLGLITQIATLVILIWLL